jgi:hypothetical protein
MSFLVVAIVFPLLLALLATGTGLLVQLAAGFVLPAALIPAVGFGAMIVISQFTVLAPGVAPLTPWVLAIVAIAGFVAARRGLRDRWRGRAPGLWLLAGAGVLSYLTVASPLLGAGQLTFPGYLLDTTAGFHLAAAEYMLHHGAPLPAPYPAYGAMLSSYYGNGYPSGGQVLLGATGWLSGQDLVWLYFPFQVFELVLSALGLTFIAERAGLPRWAAAVSGWIASAAALVTAYAMMGSIKELTALPELLAMGAMAMTVRTAAQARWRGVIPFAVAAAAALAAIGPAALAWIAILAVAFALAYAATQPAAQELWRSLAVRTAAVASRDVLPRALAGLVAAAVLVIVLAVPTVTRLGKSLTTAASLSGSNAAFAADPGNLVRPLRFVQVFGVWLGPTHRVDPRYVNQTYLLIGLAMVGVGLGLLWLVRRRAWSVIAWFAALLIVWLALYERGTAWTDAKVMMLTSPAVVLLAMIGAFGEVRRSLLPGVVLAAVLGGGVVASDALLYHGTNLAPTARFTELRSIGQRFAGQGPTLLPDFDEYAFYLLRNLDIDSPGFAADMRRPFLLVGGAAPGYGHSYDVDSIEPQFVQEFKLIVVRRSPRASRPPGNFALVSSGRYYDVWRRTGPPPRMHVAAGTPASPMGAIPCRQIGTIAQDARTVGASLRYASRPAPASANLATAIHTATAVPGVDSIGLPQLSFDEPGTIKTTVRIASTGTFSLWLGGYVDRPLTVTVDGRVVGTPSRQSGGDGNMIDVGTVVLSAGAHDIALVRPGGGLSPGDIAGTFIDGIYLEAVGTEREAVDTVAPSRWRSLCGQSLDWLEVT